MVVSCGTGLILPTPGPWWPAMSWRSMVRTWSPLSSDSTLDSVLHKPVRVLSAGSEPPRLAHLGCTCALDWAPRKQM